MGALSAAIARSAVEAGATIATNAEVRLVASTILVSSIFVFDPQYACPILLVVTT